MGCCSGRCTLAFICGMQLVSVEIISRKPSRFGRQGVTDFGKDGLLTRDRVWSG